MRVERRAVKVILTQKAEGQLVRNGFADAAGPRAQKLLYTYSVDYRGRMGIAPRRITATGFETGHVDCVFDSKAQSIQWASTRRREIESRYKGVALSIGDGGAVHSRRSWGKVSNSQSFFKERWLQAVGKKITAGSRHLFEYLFSTKHAQLPTITIRIMEPEAHVFRARSLRTNFVAGIFDIDADTLKMCERFSQRRHVRQME